MKGVISLAFIVALILSFTLLSNVPFSQSATDFNMIGNYDSSTNVIKEVGVIVDKGNKISVVKEYEFHDPSPPVPEPTIYWKVFASLILFGILSKKH